jgi:hypothetical protein
VTNPVLRLALSIVLGILVTTSTYRLVPKTKPSCKDGWHSPSIGRRGACSHHGGVQGDSLGALLFFICAGLGISAGRKLFTLTEPRESLNLYPTKSESIASSHPAPVEARVGTDPEPRASPEDSVAVQPFPFACPECGSNKHGPETYYSTIPGPDAWANVLQSQQCLDCGLHVPAHVAERWGSMSADDVRVEWQKFRRSGPNGGRRKVNPSPVRQARKRAQRKVKRASVPESADRRARPFGRMSTSELRALFHAKRNDKKMLLALLHELCFRARPGAAQLKRDVEAAVNLLP